MHSPPHTTNCYTRGNQKFCDEGKHKPNLVDHGDSVLYHSRLPMLVSCLQQRNHRISARTSLKQHVSMSIQCTSTRSVRNDLLPGRRGSWEWNQSRTAWQDSWSGLHIWCGCWTLWSEDSWSLVWPTSPQTNRSFRLSLFLEKGDHHLTLLSMVYINCGYKAISIRNALEEQTMYPVPFSSSAFLAASIRVSSFCFASHSFFCSFSALYLNSAVSRRSCFSCLPDGNECVDEKMTEQNETLSNNEETITQRTERRKTGLACNGETNENTRHMTWKTEPIFWAHEFRNTIVG